MPKNQLSVSIISIKHPDQKSSGVVNTQSWDKKERLRRAIITWASCWAGAIVTIFIPLLHFVLVPALLLAGPIASSIIFEQKEVVLGGDAKCPHCGKDVKIARGKLKWPLTDLCTSCSEEFHIHSLDNN